jgi:hypothetical protein
LQALPNSGDDYRRQQHDDAGGGDAEGLKGDDERLRLG